MGKRAESKQVTGKGEMTAQVSASLPEGLPGGEQPISQRRGHPSMDTDQQPHLPNTLYYLGRVASSVNVSSLVEGAHRSTYHTGLT